MRVTIIGSRGFKSLNLIVDMIRELQEKYGEVLEIISGGADGVDKYTKHICERLYVKFNDKAYLPDFSNGYDVGAYHRRNDRLITDGEKVIAFWDGTSPGTKSMINKCLERKKDIQIIFEPQN